MFSSEVVIMLEFGKNPYEILGVANGTSVEQCRKAAKKLSIKYHPDNGGDTEKFIAIQEALKQIEGGQMLYISPIHGKNKILTHVTLVDIAVVV